MSDPIPHQVRISSKARNVYLRFSIQHGLQITVPRGYDVRKIPQLIESKRRWIDSARSRLEKFKAARPVETLPSQIVFPAISETWQVEYVPEESHLVSIKELEPGRLMLCGKIEKQIVCRRLLQRWVLRKAQVSLIPWLRQVSTDTNLPFAKASVRWQRTRWGSCSRSRNVSLNAKLLFLRPELVRYLFIHELCHTVHMNHSDRYWAFVASKEPNYKVLDKEMRTAMSGVPGWAK